MSGLPGRRHPVPEGAMCDCHQDRPAIANVQGETDSFGYDTILMCRECLDEDRAYERSEEAHTGKCDWCKKDVTNLRWTRDYDEGLHGPVYHVCGACYDRQQKQINDELDRYDGSFDFEEDDCYSEEDWS